MKIFYQRALLTIVTMALWSVITAQEAPNNHQLPQGFVYISDEIPHILLDIRYYSAYNFVGARVEGYLSPIAILTSPATQALKKVSDELLAQGYVLKIFDAYRPQQAVDHFVRWAKEINDTLYKRVFYPNIDKSKLFALGYISSQSGHSRGSTVDLTIVELATGKELDMGAPFDFFGPISAHGTKAITATQSAHRALLKNMMLKHGFKSYSEEWWHYTLINEPYPNTYFNFEVTL